MKFTTVALLSFALGASAEIVEQCCSTYFADPFTLDPPDLIFPEGFGTGSEGRNAWFETEMLGIAGKRSGLCDEELESKLGNGACYTYDDICHFWTYQADDGTYAGQRGFPQEGVVLKENDLNCCQYNDGTLEGSEGLICTNEDQSGCCGSDDESAADQPWTCNSNYVRDPRGGNVRPVAADHGLACGRTADCKVKSICVLGDPHFQLMNGDWFDFHGECDLKYLENTQFHRGLGLEIQIRTKARYEYSFVESAAIRIGDDVLEVSAYGQYFFNGVEGADLKNAKMSDLFEMEHIINDAQHHVFNVYTEGNGEEYVQIKTFKDLVAVKVESPTYTTFGAAVGMMGDYKEGAMLARDGKTTVTDPIEFGMEWQVKAEEKTLFQTPSPVTGKCVMPSAGASAERRRLGEAVPLEAAVAACEAVNHVHHENCVYDVMATGDLEIVHSGVF